MRQNWPVTPLDVSKRRSDLHLLDVREQDEWDAGHIEGAQHIPLGELAARLGEDRRRRPWSRCAAAAREAIALPRDYVLAGSRPRTSTAA